LIENVKPLTRVQVFVQCTKRSDPPAGKSLGYIDAAYTAVFSGYIVSPWIRKRRNGSAVMAITAMADIGALAAATSYTATITPSDNKHETINIPYGGSGKLVSNVTEFVEKQNPADVLSKAITEVLKEIAVTRSPFKTPSTLNAIALGAINRLAFAAGGAAAGVTQDSWPLFQPIAAKALAGGKAVDPAQMKKMLNWSVARHIADLFYAGWAHGLSDGGGDLWMFLSLLAKSFMFSILPLPGKNDLLIPIFHGSGIEQFEIISQNEYWAVEIGKSFSMKDYAYVSGVSLYSPRSYVPVADGSKGYDLTIPSLGYAHYAIPGAVTGSIAGASEESPNPGRTQVVECPSWAVPPIDLSPEWLGDGEDPPEAGSPDDPRYSPGRPTTEFWFDYKVGSQIAKWTLGYLLFAHRVMAITGRLRFDIAPGSLVRVDMKDDLYTVKPKEYSMYGWVSEVRIVIGARGRATSAHTMMTLGHVYNGDERAIFTGDTVHPLFDKPWAGTELIAGSGAK
jgi:hypothetical protein